MRLARKVANDALRLRGATLGDRFDDLVSRLQIVGLQASLRYDPHREQMSYGQNGGDPFSSYIADVMERRVVDYFRSQSEGFGDRRYGHDNRVVVGVVEDQEADPDVDFGKLVSEHRLIEWQEAAGIVDLPMAEWVCVTLDRATAAIGRTASATRSAERSVEAGELA